MKKIEKILGVLGLCGLLALSACDATVESEADGTGSDAVTGTDTTTTGDTTVVTGYKYVTIDGKAATEKDCTATTSAGADIDAVAVYGKDGKLKGVGKPGSVVFKAGAKKLCAAENKHTDPGDVAGPLNTDATVSNGYFGLSDGTVEFKIGACSTPTEDPKKCDGNGAEVTIVPGDEIDVYEVDITYLSASQCATELAKNTSWPADLCSKQQGFQAGTITAQCKCIPETYEVFVSKEAGAGLVSLGAQTGSKAHIAIQ